MRNVRSTITLTLLAMAMLLTSIGTGCLPPMVDIPPGHEGAEYKVPLYRGTGGGLAVGDPVLNPGRHKMSKYNSMSIVVDTRPVVHRMKGIQVRMSDELNVTFDIKLTTEVYTGSGADLLAEYATRPSEAGRGTVITSDDWYTVVAPVFESVSRERLSKEGGMDIAQKRDAVTTDILANLKTQLADEPLLQYVNFKRVNIGNIDYPESVDRAIEKQAQAQAELAEKEQRLLIAEKDAEIKVVEAKGIADAQAIIDRTLTKEYLYHEWIEALEATANTPNTTMIYIPTGPDGLPVMRGVQ
jgi:hypothetical protein